MQENRRPGLVSADEQSRLLLDFLPGAAILLLDAGGRVADWNGGAARLFGYAPEEILGQHVSLFFTPEDVRAGAPENELRAAEASPTTEDRWQVRQNGTRFRASAVTTALRDAHGSLRGYARVLRDRTELDEADRRKNEWIGMLAHELRGPLSPIQNSVQSLRLGTLSESEARQAQDTILRQVRHLARLVEDLLDVSRITTGKLRLRRERVDLARLVRNASEDFRPALALAGLALAVEVPETPVWVRGDPTRLQQVVDNLVENALKFTPRGGVVTVCVEADDDEQQAALRVRDTGIGLEPEMLGKVFEPLSQAERSLHRAQGGLGLGLALVKGLAELHGGAAQVQSAGPGRGAEFVVRLPLSAEPAPLTAWPESPRPSHPLRIAVIEDNRDAAESLRLLLSLLGHNVRVAFTGTEGVELVLGWLPDVVLSDIGLPGLDGFGVARVLRENAATAGTRLIAVTGYGSENDKQRARESGFDYILTKPTDPQALLELIAVEKN